MRDCEFPIMATASGENSHPIATGACVTAENLALLDNAVAPVPARAATIASGAAAAIDDIEFAQSCNDRCSELIKSVRNTTRAIREVVYAE